MVAAGVAAAAAVRAAAAPARRRAADASASTAAARPSAAAAAPPARRPRPLAPRAACRARARAATACASPAAASSPAELRRRALGHRRCRRRRRRLERLVLRVQRADLWCEVVRTRRTALGVDEAALPRFELRAERVDADWRLCERRERGAGGGEAHLSCEMCTGCCGRKFQQRWIAPAAVLDRQRERKPPQIARSRGDRPDAARRQQLGRENAAALPLRGGHRRLANMCDRPPPKSTATTP